MTIAFQILVRFFISLTQPLAGRSSVCLWLLLLLAIGELGTLKAAEVLRFGVFAHRPREVMKAQYQPLAEYLEESLGNYQVELVTLTAEAMENALSLNRLDFLLSNPSHFIQLRNQNSLNGALANLIRMENGHTTASLGG